MDRQDIIEEIIENIEEKAEVIGEPLRLVKDTTSDADGRVYDIGFSYEGGYIVTIEKPHPMFDKSMLEDLRWEIFHTFYSDYSDIIGEDDLVLVYDNDVIEAFVL